MTDKSMAPRYEVQAYRDGVAHGEPPGWYRLGFFDDLEPSQLSQAMDKLAPIFPGVSLRLVEWRPRVVEWSFAANHPQNLESSVEHLLSELWEAYHHEKVPMRRFAARTAAIGAVFRAAKAKNLADLSIDELILAMLGVKYWRSKILARCRGLGEKGMNHVFDFMQNEPAAKEIISRCHQPTTRPQDQPTNEP